MFINNASIRVLDNIAKGFKQMGPTVFSGLAWGPVVQTHQRNQIGLISKPIDFFNASLYACSIAVASYTTGEMVQTIRNKAFPRQTPFLKRNLCALSTIAGGLGIFGHLYAMHLKQQKRIKEDDELC